MKRSLRFFSMGLLLGVGLAVALVWVSPGDTDLFQPYQIGQGALTVYERTVAYEVQADGTRQQVATTLMLLPGILAWGCLAGVASMAVGIAWQQLTRGRAPQT